MLEGYFLGYIINSRWAFLLAFETSVRCSLFSRCLGAIELGIFPYLYMDINYWGEVCINE